MQCEVRSIYRDNFKFNNSKPTEFRIQIFKAGYRKLDIEAGYCEPDTEAGYQTPDIGNWISEQYWKLNIESWILISGNQKQDIGNRIAVYWTPDKEMWISDTGYQKLYIENRIQEAGYWKLDKGSWISGTEYKSWNIGRPKIGMHSNETNSYIIQQYNIVKIIPFAV